MHAHTHGAPYCSLYPLNVPFYLCERLALQAAAASPAAVLQRATERRRVRSAYKLRERVARLKYYEFVELEKHKFSTRGVARRGTLDQFVSTGDRVNDPAPEEWPAWLGIGKNTTLGPPSVALIKTYTYEAYARVEPILTQMLMGRQPLWVIRSDTVASPLT